MLTLGYNAAKKEKTKTIPHKSHITKIKIEL